MIELTQEQREFLIAILDGVQLSGTTAQIRETLAMIDSIIVKIKQEPNNETNN